MVGRKGIKPGKPRVLLPLLLSGMVVLGMLIGYKLADDHQSSLLIQGKITDDSRAKLEDIIKLIENKYVDSINAEQLHQWAIEGIMSHLDPFSMYLNESDAQYLDEEMNGAYFGLGIESILVKDTIIITDVIENSPADQAGLKVMDKVIAINEQRLTDSIKWSGIKKLINERDDDMVDLTYLRKSQKTISHIGVRLSDVPLEIVSSKAIINNDIAYVHLSKLVSGSYKAFIKALEELNPSEFNHLILDLRGNQGGYLSETVQIASQFFIEKDQLIVYTKGKSENKTEYNSSGNSFFGLDQIVVLMDSLSASGSEIIAGAIQDWDRGLIVGSTSYGKGLVQEQFPLAQNEGLRLTIARYYTPVGRSIQKPLYALDTIDSKTLYSSLREEKMLRARKGVEPDIAIGPDDCQITMFQNQENDVPELAYQLISDANLDMETSEYVPDKIESNLRTAKNNISPKLTEMSTSECRQNLAYQHALKILLGNDDYVRLHWENDQFISTAVQTIESK